jgi:hypothetical protein
VKKPTGELYEEAHSIVFFPLKKTTEGKEYFFKTYNTEVKKVGGEGIVTYSKAAIATGFIVTQDTYNWFVAFWGPKKAQAKEVLNEKVNN